MKITLDYKKSVEQNAAAYFEKAKKHKKKIEGIKKTIAEHEKKLSQEQKKEVARQEKQQKQRAKKNRKKEWYEKFRWFVSSNGFLVVGGRDATTNDILIKKHTEPSDVVFHTEAPGSPFVVVKNPDKKTIPKSTQQEAADFCASFGKAWKLGLSAVEVYAIAPDQVSKEAKSGEYLGKGAFMIYGKRTYFSGKMNLGLCEYQGKVMVGPQEAVKKHADSFVLLTQGNKKLSEVAKKAQKKIDADLDEIVRVLPQGVEIRK